MGTAGLGSLVRESIVIGAWVALWRPLEIFLYDWWPIRAEARLYDRLSAMPVRIVEATAETAFDPSRRDRVLMFNAEEDEIVPAESGRRLWEAYGSPEIVWVPAGHYTAIFFLPQLLERTTAHFNKLLLGR